jgi:hypothetical protein
MAIAFAAGATGNTATGTTTSTALSVTTVAGQLLVVSYADDSATTTTFTAISDNFANSWTAADSFRLNGVTYRMYYAVLATGKAGASHTVTATWSTAAAGRCTIAVQYFNGFTGTPTLDKVNGGTGSSVSANNAVTTATTTQANELVVVGAAHGSTTSAFTLGTGYTNLSTVNVANAAIAQESKVVTATGAQTGIITIAAARVWASTIATFYDNTGGGTPPPATNTGNMLMMFY